jgi:hypothetical protein
MFLIGKLDPASSTFNGDVRIKFVMRLRTTLRPCVIALGLFAALLPAAAQNSPVRQNFTGRWRMIKDQSDFGKFTVPNIVTRAVDHHDPTLNVHTVQTTGKNTTTSDVSYFTDGKESSNIMSGRDATSKAFWDGPVLMIRTETKDSKGENIEIVDRWDLSSGGRILTITSHVAGPDGGADLKLVCQKQ